MRRRALIAIAFAGGLLSPQLPALSKTETESNPSETKSNPADSISGNTLKPTDSLSKDKLTSTDSESKDKLKSQDSVMQRILNNADLAPETKAFDMLLMANSYLQGDSSSSVDAQFVSAATESSTRGSFTRRKRAWEGSLLFLAQRLSTDHTNIHADNIKLDASSNHKNSPDHTNTNSNHSDLNSNRTDTNSNNSDLNSNRINTNSNNSDFNSNHTVSNSKHTVSRLIPEENLVLANLAMQQALAKLEDVRAPFAKLNMYFIASRLFQKMGNVDQARKCNQVLEKTFQSYETNSSAYEDEVKAASSVLDSMSYCLIPVRIADRKPITSLTDPPIPKETPRTSFNEKDFQATEKLKLRAVAMADRLDSTNHVRRKVHRDLVLWYKQLGKSKLADKEKQVLFGLVGINDDSILYPYSPGCADLVWWEKDNQQFGFECGMG